MCVRDPNKLGTTGMWWVGSETQEARKPVRTVAGLESTSGALGQQMDPVCCGKQGSRAGASISFYKSN